MSDEVKIIDMDIPINNEKLNIIIENDLSGMSMVRDGKTKCALGMIVSSFLMNIIQEIETIEQIVSENKKLKEENKKMKEDLSHKWIIDIRRFPNWVRQRLSKFKKS